MASSISFCEGTCPTDSKNFLMSLYSRTPPVANLSNATSYSETYETRMLTKEKTNLISEINYTNDSNKYFELHTQNHQGWLPFSHMSHPGGNLLRKHKTINIWRGGRTTRHKVYPDQLNRLKRVEKIASPQIVKRNSTSFRRKRNFRSTYCAKVGARAKNALASTFSTNWRGKRLQQRL